MSTAPAVDSRPDAPPHGTPPATDPERAAGPPPAPGGSSAGDPPESGSTARFTPRTWRITAALIGALVVNTVGVLLATRVGVTTTATVGGSTAVLAAFGGLAVWSVGALDRARTVAHREAAASHNQLQKLIDNTSAIMYMKRVDNGRYLLVNREWERLFGVRRERVVNLTDHGVFPAELADQLRANDLGVARAGRTVQYEETAEGDDGLRTYMSVKFPVLDGDGTPYAVCGISTDITDRKRAEEEVRLLNAELENRVRERTAELEASTQELDAFAYSVSHDLRAPLRSIHGFSEALAEDYTAILDDAGRDHLGRIQHNVQRMGRMIDDLLDLSRATRVELIREKMDLSAIAREIVAELTTTDPGRVVTCAVADGMSAYGDPQLVRLALHNLLANAWKFTARQPAPVIEVGITHRDNREFFFIRDNGAGFDMQYADKLFTAFQRLHPAAEFEGTGIGLAIVARVIRRHGGQVSTLAEPDHGATFYFNLTSATETVR